MRDYESRHFSSAYIQMGTSQNRPQSRLHLLYLILFLRKRERDCGFFHEQEWSVFPWIFLVLIRIRTVFDLRCVNQGSKQNKNYS